MSKLWWAIITNKTIELKICIPMWPTVAWLQQQDSSTFVYNHLVTRLNSSTLVYIRLWLAYIRLHSSRDSSTLVYIRLWLVYIRLHSSSDSSVFRIDPKKTSIIWNMVFMFTFFFNGWVNNYSNATEKVRFLNANK